MKNVFIMAAVCLLLVSACGKTDTKKAPAVSAATDQPLKRDASLVPNYSGLIEEYRTILQEDPNNLAAIIALGNAYFDDAQWKQAITMYEHALLLDSRNADVRTDMGTAYRNIGMMDRALAEYRTALTYDRGHLNARYNMGVIFASNKKDYKAAVRVWKELLKLAPNYPHAETIRSAIMTLEKPGAKDERRSGV